MSVCPSLCHALRSDACFAGDPLPIFLSKQGTSVKPATQELASASEKQACCGEDTVQASPQPSSSKMTSRKSKLVVRCLRACCPPTFKATAISQLCKTAHFLHVQSSQWSQHSTQDQQPLPLLIQWQLLSINNESVVIADGLLKLCPLSVDFHVHYP